MVCTGAGALGAADTGMAQAVLEEVTSNPIRKLPELTQDWEKILLEGTNRTLCTRTQEKGAVTPQETDPDLPVSVQESPAEAWVGGGLRQCWGQSLAVCAWDLLKEITIIFFTYTTVWLQINSSEGTQLYPPTENWIKDLLSMAPPIRTRPSLLLSHSLPSGSFHKPLILPHQRVDRLKTTITEN